MSNELRNNPPEPSPDDEEDAYQKLDELIDTVESDPKKSLAKELKENKDSRNIYSHLMAEWLGVEVASLYAAPPEPGGGTSPERKPIEFLYEAVPEAVDLPMFWVSENGNGKRLLSNNIDDTEVEYRRKEQDKKRQSSQEQLTAELCARALREQPYLLLPFGEILAYCFLYHVLEEIPPRASDEDIAWPKIGRQAWNKLCQAHVKRPHATPEKVEFLLRDTLREWYFSGAVKEDRSFLHTDKISGIYLLDADVSNLLSAANGQTPDANTDFAHFLMRWAQVLYSSLQSSGKSNTLMESFWRRTLINPDIEELLCTRGLYATIIRSPFTRESQASSNLSEAYAICTLFDADRLKSNDKWRKRLDDVLHRVGHEDLATYDFLRLQRTDDYQRQILNLLQAVSNPNIDSEQLMEKTAILFQYISKAERVFIAWSDVGLYMLSEGRGVNDSTREAWFGYLTAVVSDASSLASNLPSDNSVILDRATNKSCDDLLTQICDGLQIKDYKQNRILMFPLGDRQGVVVLFSSSKDRPSAESHEQLKKIALTLEVGMELPFRNAIGRGFFSGMLRVSCHPITSIRNVRSSFLGWKENRTTNTHRMLNWFVASIVEFNRIGLVAVGVLFSYLVFSILWHTAHGEAQEQDIAKTLGQVERTVMAFSICLAATGVIFLLKPGMSAGQPKWMRRFAELGTLEQTLVRLAAMVLTIHVLKVALEANIALTKATTNVSELWMAMQPTLFHVVVYLMVLVGLVFLSKFLLGEDSGESEKQKNRSTIETARRKKQKDAEVEGS
jgi:uncharacterized membrane protein YqhA